MSTSKLPPTVRIPPSVKIPQQKRSREKFNAILQAAERLFIEQGIPGTSVAQIAEEAGVSIGTFYQRFESKEALIHTIFYLLDDEIDSFEDAVQPTGDRELQETVESIVSVMIELYTDKQGILLALLLAVQDNADIRRYVAVLRRRMADVFSAALMVHKNDIGARRFKTAVAMSLRVLNSYLDQYLVWADHESTDATLKYKTSHKELVKMILGYLKAA